MKSNSDHTGQAIQQILELSADAQITRRIARVDAGGQHEENFLDLPRRFPIAVAWDARSGIGEVTHRQNHNLRWRTHERD